MTKRNKDNPPPCKPLPTGSVRTTAELAETILNNLGRTNHAIPVCSALWGMEADLPIDPYLLGVWLGDGSTRTGHMITSADPEIMDEFIRCGYHIGRVTSQVNNKSVQYTPYGLKKQLRELGVIGNKHIPVQYLRASPEQRLSLLQGLLDTDGTVAKKSGSVVFTSTKRVLAEAVQEIACSLGWKAMVSERRARISGVDFGPAFNVHFSPDKIVFRLNRKASSQKLERRPTTRFRYLMSCRRVDPRPMRCITVDNPTGLFLVGRSFVPTHNTQLLLGLAGNYG